MGRRRLFFVLAAGAVLLLLFANCMPVAMSGEEAAQCCASTHCSPATKMESCCKTPLSAHAPSVMVKARVSMVAPIPKVARWVSSLQVASYKPVRPVHADDIPLFSPPDLCTLHASFLI
jgi:hypothetical protein